jgi:Tol biopolymer transport system component
MRISSRPGVISLIAAMLLSLVTTSARASFPGENGRIAFSTDWTNPSQIYTIRPDGTGLRQLTHATSRKGAMSPAWSADGTRIAFVMDRHIWVMNADGTGQRQLTSDEGFRDRRPAWSPDGTTIVFSHCDVSFGFKAYCDLELVDADGSNERQLLGGNWIYDWPRYSPDGSRIAFAGDRDGFVCAIWVMDADGTDPVRLTDPAIQANVPDWSPDGSTISFGTHCKLAGGRVWAMGADGSDQHELVADDDPHADWGSPRFAPDGTGLVVVGPDYGVFLVPGAGGQPERIFAAPPRAISLDWGPKAAAG